MHSQMRGETSGFEMMERQHLQWGGGSHITHTYDNDRTGGSGIPRAAPSPPSDVWL